MNKLFVVAIRYPSLGGTKTGYTVALKMPKHDDMDEETFRYSMVMNWLQQKTGQSAYNSYWEVLIPDKRKEVLSSKIADLATMLRDYAVMYDEIQKEIDGE